MGAQYEVNLSNVQSVLAQQRPLSGRLGMANMSVLQAQTMLRLTMSPAVRSGIDTKLNKIRQDLEATSQSVRKMNNTLEEIVGIYKSTEQEAMNAQQNLSATGSGEPVSMLGQIWEWVKENIPGSESVIDTLKDIEKWLKGIGGATGSDEVSLVSKIFAVLSGAFEIANSTPQEIFGDVIGYVSDSFSLIEKLAGFFEDNVSNVLDKFQLTKIGNVTSVISSVTGFAEDLAGAFEKWFSTTGNPIENVASGIEKFIGSMGSFAESIVDGAELKAVVDAIKSGSVNAVGEVKKVFKTAQSWLTLGKTIADTIGSGVSTTLKLTADGQLSGQDIGEIGFTSAIHGLDTLISGVTFGLFSCETILGKDVDTVVSDVKSWASNLSSNAAAYITNNPERLQEYNEAGPFKQACMTIGAIFAGNTKENRVKDLSEGISPAGGVVGFMSASRIPNMSPIYSSASGAGGGFSVGGGNGGGGGGAGAR